VHRARAPARSWQINLLSGEWTYGGGGEDYAKREQSNLGARQFRMRRDTFPKLALPEARRLLSDVARPVLNPCWSQASDCRSTVGFALPLAKQERSRYSGARGRAVRRAARPRRGRSASPAGRLSCPCSRAPATRWRRRGPRPYPRPADRGPGRGRRAGGPSALGAPRRERCWTEGDFATGIDAFRVFDCVAGETRDSSLGNATALILNELATHSVHQVQYGFSSFHDLGATGIPTESRLLTQPQR
jgi:hypothetical protein